MNLPVAAVDLEALSCPLTVSHKVYHSFSLTFHAAARAAGGSSRGLGQSVMNFYTDDSPGLKIQPVRLLRFMMIIACCTALDA